MFVCFVKRKQLLAPGLPEAQTLWYDIMLDAFSHCIATVINSQEQVYIVKCFMRKM